jgi:CRP/FNR family transcriptional regulator, cyclic AMP receptor protein
MDTSSFFNYPTLPAQPQPAASLEIDLLSGHTEDDWAVLLSYFETRRFRPGDWLIREGEAERALYLLSDGRLEVQAGGTGSSVVEAPATLGEEAFLDGQPSAAGLRALTHGEAQRLSFEAFEVLSAREPRLARDLLLDLGRLVATELRRLQSPDRG